MINFPFPTVFSIPFRELPTVFIKVNIVVCNFFQFGIVQNLSFGKGLKSSSNNKILDSSKFKAFADTLNMAEKIIYVLDWIENTVRNGENADYQNFLLSPQYFQKPSSSGSLNLGLHGKRFERIQSDLLEKGKLKTNYMYILFSTVVLRLVGCIRV